MNQNLIIFCKRVLLQLYKLSHHSFSKIDYVIFSFDKKLNCFVDKNLICKDDNVKIIKRDFKINDVVVNILLCKNCSLDSDFSGFISETKISAVLQN